MRTALALARLDVHDVCSNTASQRNLAGQSSDSEPGLYIVLHTSTKTNQILTSGVALIGLRMMFSHNRGH